MTSSKDFFAEYPSRIETRPGDKRVKFELETDRYAIHRSGSEPAVTKGTPASEKKEGSVGPVYSIQPSGTIAIPTGRVFVRFKKGTKAADRKDEIETAGYVISEEVGYAPEAAWLEDASGDIGKALGGISKLEKLADVENIEPQMLMPRVAR